MVYEAARAMLAQTLVQSASAPLLLDLLGLWDYIALCWALGVDELWYLVIE